MINTIRLFILVEAASFAVASLVHTGVFITGYEHPQARIAEGIIAAVLLIGLILTFVNQTWTRQISFIVQGFALLGTLVGLFTIAIGVGPRTVPDLVYHAAIIAVLGWGLFVTTRAQLRPIS